MPLNEKDLRLLVETCADMLDADPDDKEDRMKQFETLLEKFSEELKTCSKKRLAEAILPRVREFRRARAMAQARRRSV
jgi:hypothetical protein